MNVHMEDKTGFNERGNDKQNLPMNMNCFILLSVIKN